MEITKDIKVCSKCGESKSLDEFYYSKGRYKSQCKSCHKKYFGVKKHTGNCSICNKPIKDRAYTFCHECKWEKRQKVLNDNIDIFLSTRYIRLKNNAKKRDIYFNIKKEYVVELYNKQKGICFYTDEKMSCISGEGLKQSQLSFDRIDNSKGYIPGNIVLCTYRANTLKRDMSFEYIEKMYLRIRDFKEEISIKL